MGIFIDLEDVEVDTVRYRFRVTDTVLNGTVTYQDYVLQGLSGIMGLPVEDVLAMFDNAMKAVAADMTTAIDNPDRVVDVLRGWNVENRTELLEI